MTWDHKNRKTHVVTYGVTLTDCTQAAHGGNIIKKALGWPEALCNAKPSRKRSKERKALAPKDEVVEVNATGKKDLKEGPVSKGGINKAPVSSRPEPPKGQGDTEQQTPMSKSAEDALHSMLGRHGLKRRKAAKPKTQVDPPQASSGFRFGIGAH